uniref:uncharacterized protein LOC105352887 n=1 Tax=Fragaria vesca subsp. vesca TaxID=101020 RepID=UPI0005C84FFA|nr:PREDICTED: uncharacterized protein LOC105352887 [Fragaria vesca subsp. vesca]
MASSSRNNRVALNLFPLTASPTDRRKRALRSLAELKDEDDRSIQLSLSVPPPNEPRLPPYEPAFPQTLILIQSNQPGSLATFSARLCLGMNNCGWSEKFTLLWIGPCLGFLMHLTTLLLMRMISN